MKINFDELEFDPVCQVITTTASYQGKPFTGIAFIEDQKFHEYGEYAYSNGNAHGRWFSINTKNKQLISEEFYENSTPINEHRTWFHDGKNKQLTRYQNGEIIFSQTWNKDGVLIIEVDNIKHTYKEWYDDNKTFRLTEKLPDHSDGSTEKIFHENGDLLMEIRRIKNNTDQHYFFNTDFLYTHFNLLNSYHYDVLKNFFLETLKKVPLSPDQKFLQLLHNLTSHSEPFFRYEAARILGDRHSPESIKHLEKLLSDTSMPALYDRLNFKKMATIWSVGEMAKKTLEKIRHS